MRQKWRRKKLFTTLQAMQPVKLSGSAAFVTDEAYDVVARFAECSYEDIVANLEDRRGQPATVAVACIEKLTVGPKLGNRDFIGL